MRANVAAAAFCALAALGRPALADGPGTLGPLARLRWLRPLEAASTAARPGWLPALADAGQAQAPEQQTQEPSPPPASPEGRAPPAPGQDFDLLAPEKPPDETAKQRDVELMLQLGRRRRLLQLHQLGGYATMATLTAAVVLGQINYLDKYGGGGDTGRWITPHAIAAFTAAGVFTATGLLALLAPSPLEKPQRVDTATLHRIAMAVATAGMVAQVVLGPITASKEGQLSQRDFALAHQIIGYTTLVATYAGFLVLTF
jgi:hypothetical protein